MTNIIVKDRILSQSKINRYKSSDFDLINSKEIQRSFGRDEDYIEFHLYNNLKQLLVSYNDFKAYKPLQLEDGLITSLELDPKQNLLDLNYNRGIFYIQYLFLRKKISDNLCLLNEMINFSKQFDLCCS